MNLWKAILLMPTLLIRSEPYLIAIRAMSVSYLNALILTLIGTSLSILIWFSLINVLPEHITSGESKNGNRVVVWHRNNQHKNKVRAEKIHAWLTKQHMLFLLPVVLIILNGFPWPLPLPVPVVTLFLVKITDYSPQGLFFILGANVLKIYITVSIIYKIF